MGFHVKSARLPAAQFAKSIHMPVYLSPAVGIAIFSGKSAVSLNETVPDSSYVQ